MTDKQGDQQAHSYSGLKTTQPNLPDGVPPSGQPLQRSRQTLSQPPETKGEE